MQRVKTYLIVVHIAGWLLFMAFPLLFLNNYDQAGNSLSLFGSPYYWLFCFTYIILFYINAYFFIPALFLRRKYLKYTIVASGLFLGIYFLQPFDRLVRYNDNRSVSHIPQGPPPHVRAGGEFGPPPQGSPPGQQDSDHKPPGQMPGYAPPPPNQGLGRARSFVDSTSLFILVMIIALSTATRTIEQLQITEQRVLLAETDKASAELSFLKAQINPHFLFNTLNNIYTLALVKDDQAPHCIMKLSNIMRYVTDDTMEDFVPLQNELDFIEDYIELQRLRLGEKTKVEVSFAGNTANKTIPPLLLMTFVENVFKHGISNRESSVIIINVIAAEDRILLFCENSVFLDTKQKTRTGIGLANSKKRLEHLYPGKHLLDIRNEDGMFAVNLTLQS
jgi:two-component system, LytTR family, sensor kinase